VDLQTVVDRYAEALTVLDDTTEIVNENRRTKEPYPASLKSLWEAQVVAGVDRIWYEKHPTEFLDPSVPRVEIAYPTLDKTACDHVFSTKPDTSTETSPQAEWAIEVKHIALVGHNGKRGDHETSKMLSPYLKDRGMLHDVARLRHYRLARRHAVIGYAFSYDNATCAAAEKRHDSAVARETIKNIRDLVRTNGGTLTVRPLQDFAESILGLRGYLKGTRAQTDFEAWRHPAGGVGVVWGWEVRRPELEPDWDPRHPW